MLYPQTNQFRQIYDLSGFWDFRFDPEDRGRIDGWTRGLAGGRPVAVPASWNDQLEEGRDFLGPAWYSTSFVLPESWAGKRTLLRFGSVNYIAEVWLNDKPLGIHEGGHLPFEFDLKEVLQPGRNILSVRVDGNLAPDRVPPGNVPLDLRDCFGTEAFPATSFDFFPYCGIQRPVILSALPRGSVEDITVDTQMSGSSAHVRVHFLLGEGAESARVTLTSPRIGPNGAAAQTEIVRASDLKANGEGDVLLEISKPYLWGTDDPHLYDLTVEVLRGKTTCDSYSIPIGIRTIHVQGNALLLNNKPVFLKGFGRHEDFPITGRGLAPAVIIKDYALMKWVGANSFRSTHYPYSEQMLDLADKLGFLVLDETPSVGLFFNEAGYDRRLDLAKRYVRDLISRDRNHPSVIAWSVANEPHSNRPEARPFLKELLDLAREIDPSRIATVPSYVGKEDPALEYSDIISLNRYYGWYQMPGRIDEACARLSGELDDLHSRFHKPVFLSEFGAETVAGCHAEPPEMFSEEYQVELIHKYINVLASKSYVVGSHVWNLCDFKTSQDLRRFGGVNLKGVFTRDRRPKMAAHLLRELWNK
jgi:beta-glucuronidase